MFATRPHLYLPGSCSLPDPKHDCSPPFSLPRTPTANFRTSSCSLRDWGPSRDCVRPVFATGPQVRPPAPSDRYRASTARQQSCQIERQKESERLSEAMSEDMPERTSEDMPQRRPEDMPERIWNRRSEDMPEWMSEQTYLIDSIDSLFSPHIWCKAHETCLNWCKASMQNQRHAIF